MKTIVCVRLEGAEDFESEYQGQKIIALIESNHELVVEYTDGPKNLRSCLLSKIVGETVIIYGKEYTIKENAQIC